MVVTLELAALVMTVLGFIASIIVKLINRLESLSLSIARLEERVKALEKDVEHD